MTKSLSLLALVHFAVNGILLWLGYYWLGVPESRAGTLAWSAAIALLVVLVASWSYGSGLVYFSEEGDERTVRAWRLSLRHLLPFALAVVTLIVVYWLLARWGDYSAKPAFRMASWLTLKLRRPVRPASVQRGFDAVLWLVRWMAIPVLVLPVLAAVAKSGWRGFPAPGTNAKKWLYRIQTPLLLLCAVRLPLLLVYWVPHTRGFWIETASFVIRAGMAYLLFAGAWLVLAFVTSGGKPRLTHPSTVVSP
jgi:hypothetical protein